MIAANNKELKMLEKAAAEFSHKYLASRVRENDKYPFGPFYDDVLQKTYALDFFHAILPEALGGMGLGIGGLCIILDNISQGDGSLGGIMFTNAFAQKIILNARGEDALGAIISAATRPNQCLIAFPVFNNCAEIEHLALATRDKEKFILSGTLEYLVLGGIAAHAVIPAKIEGQTDYSFFLVDMSDERIIKSDTVLSLGFHACPAIDITLKDVEAKLIGNEANGHTYFDSASDVMHLAAAGISVGIMKGAFREAYEYSRKRFQGGREIFNWSEIQMILANMAIKIKIAEMAIAQACHAVDNCLSQWQQCSRAAAIHVQEMACDVTTDGIQVLGGNGYMEDFGQARRYRDAKQAQSLLGLAPMKKLSYLGTLF